MDISEVTTAILNGDFDDDIEAIREAIKQRRNVRAAIVKANLKIGDRVRFVNGRPNYLVGLEAIVRDKKRTRIGIEFVDKAAARKYGYGVITASPDMVEPITSEG